VGVLITAQLFFIAIGPRPDLAKAALQTRFLVKFVFTIALAASAASVFRVVATAYPLSTKYLLPIELAPLLLLCAIGIELMVLPQYDWALIDKRSTTASPRRRSSGPEHAERDGTDRARGQCGWKFTQDGDCENRRSNRNQCDDRGRCGRTK
jgi:hypothetical protein